MFATLPTATQRAGQLGVAVQNPVTGAQYANGTVPTAAISAFATQVLAVLPLPNLSGSSNNYESAPRSQNFYDKGDVRLDGHISERNNAFVRISQRKVHLFTPAAIPEASGGGADGEAYLLGQQFAAGDTIVLSSRAVLEARLGVTHAKNSNEPIGAGGPSMQDLYGITGLPTDPRVTGGLTTQTITGFTALGRKASAPQYQNP